MVQFLIFGFIIYIIGSAIFNRTPEWRKRWPNRAEYVDNMERFGDGGSRRLAQKTRDQMKKALKNEKLARALDQQEDYFYDCLHNPDMAETNQALRDIERHLR